MKKTLSVVLAVMMIFALMVPSFANTYDPDGTNEAIIKTTETTTDGKDGATWEVTYDAVTDIPWNSLSTDVEYTATAHLRYNETLSVDVAASQDSKMVLADDAQYTIAYTLANTACEIGPVAIGDDAHTQTFQVNVLQAQWDAAPVGAYSDTITFTATVA